MGVSFPSPRCIGGRGGVWLGYLGRKNRKNKISSGSTLSPRVYVLVDQIREGRRSDITLRGTNLVQLCHTFKRPG